MRMSSEAYDDAVFACCGYEESGEEKDNHSYRYCGSCNGSGEGMHDGATCSSCKGSGVEK